MRVSREFKANFDLVAKHYRLAELGELDDAKDAVRRDPEGAHACFAAMGAWVRQQAVSPKVRTSLAIITQAEIDERPRAYGPCCRARLHSLLASARRGEPGTGPSHSGGARCCATGLELVDRTAVPGTSHGIKRAPRAGQERIREPLQADRT